MKIQKISDYGSFSCKSGIFVLSNFYTFFHTLWIFKSRQVGLFESLNCKEKSDTLQI